MAAHDAHPSHVSIPHAFAVLDVLHNRATAKTWTVLDAWVVESGLDAVVADVVEILRMNGTERLDTERAWWRSQLAANVS